MALTSDIPAGGGGGVDFRIFQHLQNANNNNVATEGLIIAEQGTGIENRGIDTASTLTSMPRLIRQVLTTGGASWIGHGVPIWMLGSSANMGGFSYKVLGGIETWTSADIDDVFCGFTSTYPGSITGTDFSNWVEFFGFGMEASDSVWYVVHNSTTPGSETKTATSVTATAGNLVKFELSSVPNSGQVDWVITDIDASSTDSGSITTNLPGTTTRLHSSCYIDQQSGATTNLELSLWSMDVSSYTY
jgi:hypothetical protein